jgi:hypothetical protein
LLSALERALNGTAPADDSSLGIKAKWKSPEETIHEEAEPTTLGLGKRLHRRETAETEI